MNQTRQWLDSSLLILWACLESPAANESVQNLIIAMEKSYSAYFADSVKSAKEHREEEDKGNGHKIRSW